MRLLKCGYNTKQDADIASMKVIFSFDYELFFGANSGSPEKCMLEPAEALAIVAAEHRAPLCFFVDTGYLLALRKFRPSSEVLGAHDTKLRRNLDELAAQGHEMLLHVHPHWEDTIWADGNWRFDLSRYCLSAFEPRDVLAIVERHAAELRPYTRNGRIYAYRAGGWAVQPFPPIGHALKAAGIRIDSTVFPGGHDSTGKSTFNFELTPPKSTWRFDADPTVEKTQGDFLEVPTSSMTVSPLYYWRLAFARLTNRTSAQPFGDGTVRPLSTARGRIDKLNKLFATTRYCVTLDGMKAGLAMGEYRRARQRGRELLVLLSHPKMMTRFSMECMRRLLQEIHRNGDEVVGYEHFELAASQPTTRPMP
jgi:hypothetical protein